MFEHRTIDLFEKILPDLNYKIGTDSKNVHVEGRMVNLAHCQSISNRGNAGLI